MADRRNAAAVLGAKRHLKWTLSALQLDKHWRRTRLGGEKEKKGAGLLLQLFILFFKC